ncbi:BnaCnng27910D [Brassica napus]|uniref:(rape) hypothetical protein n=1 Tax=Brassica napus TaxID=3708 RepID=A0A078J054_BRANA|nr:unnamed protein product [Brassica napus]CDY54992.1 BnaCnng27910D [Brassica napus]
MGGKFYGDLLVQNFIERLIRMILILFSSFRGLNYIYESRQKTMRGCFIFSIRVRSGFQEKEFLRHESQVEEEAYEEAEEEETKDETAI